MYGDTNNGTRFNPKKHVVPPVHKPPRAGYSHELEADSSLVKAARSYYPEGEGTKNCSEYPPLMQPKSWTRGVPYRDGLGQSKPMDSIGNCYNTQLKSVRVFNIPPKRKLYPTKYGPIGPNGELQYPKFKMKADIEKERHEEEAVERKKRKSTKGLVPLTQLISGEYYAKQREMEQARKNRIQRRKKEIEAKKLAAQLEFDRRSARMESEIPQSPDDQKKNLIKQIEKEHYQFLSPESLKRINYYMEMTLSGFHLPDYPWNLYEKARVKVDMKTQHIKKWLLPAVYNATVRQSEEDIIDGFQKSMKRCILQYILEDPSERKRLSIKFIPPLWPAITVRAPIPWHNDIMIGKQTFYYRYYIGNAILVELRQMWQKRYDNIVICNMDKMQEGLQFPHYCDIFDQRLMGLCTEMRNELMHNWLPDVADMMVRMRAHWAKYVSQDKQQSTFQVEEFFKTVHGLMSQQLRDLVQRSLEHFAERIIYYYEGNYYGTEYADFTFIKRPLFRVKAVPHPGTQAITFEPTLNDIKSMIVKWFNDIIHVNQNMPSIDTMLYRGHQRPQPKLLAVYSSEETIANLITKTTDIFDSNRFGPETFLNRYQEYFYILNGTAKEELLEFFKTDPFPYLKVMKVSWCPSTSETISDCFGSSYSSLRVLSIATGDGRMLVNDEDDFAERIYEYEQLRDKIAFLRRNIPLNMLMLDCAPVNNCMWEIVSGLRMYIVDYFRLENRTHNRRICDQYDEMSQRASEMPDTTAQLVELINYIMDCRDCTMFDLKEQSRTTAENVLFLMDHAHLSCKKA